MEIKVLRRTVGIFGGRGFLKKRFMYLLSLIGGVFMEQINRKEFDGAVLVEKKNVINNTVKDIAATCQFFYSKHLLRAVSHNQKEIQKAKRSTIEKAMIEFIRMQ